MLIVEHVLGNAECSRVHSNLALAVFGWFMLGDQTIEGRLSRKRKKLKTSEYSASLFLDAIADNTDDVVCNLIHDKPSLCDFPENYSVNPEPHIEHNGSKRQPRCDRPILPLQNAQASRKGGRQRQRYQDCCSEYV
nr:eukaryotic translation initiation factor 5 [Haemonchus contortus]